MEEKYKKMNGYELSPVFGAVLAVILIGIFVDRYSQELRLNLENQFSKEYKRMSKKTLLKIYQSCTMGKIHELDL